ncbi:serine/threonine protein kinase [Cellulomonas cellasea DSM 20118]|uniref:non-specific serine/threonine protein kinase n=2 Tax=Cellulomonas cellasea TaxID=43670 RepID=A0A0A0B8F3_9CELL|nr:Stk1 family PASTA domain-containing Ser/Thr kinase [Cellulomonas cellasea]KGM03160.1 serine/threonine protein kinase [Cellulomonas cellasea DSM 20118]GEA87272.1 protein kinase [Cellulomonas cellasea]
MVDDGSRILGGRYEVGELIGRGGMAEVHIGHDTRLGRTVAIKVLRSDLARDPSFQARFRREAQAAASLNHPAVVAVYDTGEDLVTEPSGVVAHVPFIVMEYVEGHTVRDILRDGNAVPIEEAVEITAGVLSALEYSHHAGIVHRDIKPANVMLTPTGAVKVMDFGIARAVADSAATMTQTQAVIGTAQYLSPEQARGETVDTRSDLYSTGCLLFELLTGRPPFVGDSPVAVAYQHVREAAPAPSMFAADVPDSLDRITLKALAKERDSRYSTAAEFRSDLEAAARGGHVGAPPVGALVPAGANDDATQVFGAAGPATTQLMPSGPAPWAPTGPGTSVLPPTGAATGAAAEDDEPKNKRWLMWTLIAVAVLAVAGIIALIAANAANNDGPEMVAVPAIVDMPAPQAKVEIEGAGFLWDQEEVESDTVAEGNVVSSTPASGREAPKGSTVTVQVSTGPDTATVPDVTGLTQDAARTQIEAAGLTVGTITPEDSASHAKDRVTKTEPAANTSAKAGSAVTVFIASGNVVVPELVGLPQADAEKALADLSLSSTTAEKETNEQPPGTVVSQSRAAGDLVPQNSSVRLEVAVAPTALLVPEGLVGQSWDQVSRTLSGLGLQPQRRDVDSDQPKDSVIKTDPTQGDEVEPGQVVVVDVSRGPRGGQPNPNPSVTVPVNP